MSLREKLEALWRSSPERVGPEVHRLFETFLAELSASGLTKSSLKEGDRIPEFMLPDADGRLVSSTELLERGALVVSFFRGDWCPYCAVELQALQETLPEIEAAGAALIAITPDTGSVFQRPARRYGLSYHVLSDADNGVGLQFGVVYRVPDDLRAAYLKLGLDLGARHGNVAWFLPIPATYVVDRTGVIRHAELDTDFSHRMEPADIVQQLKGLDDAAGSGG